MSNSEEETMSEREFAAELEGKIPALFGMEPEEKAEVVEDAPPRPVEPEPEPDAPVEEPPLTEEPTEEEPPEEESLSWAKRKYGEDVSLERLSRIAFEQEQTVSRLGSKAKENEALAGEWYQYAQNLEAQMQRQPTGMPMSASEEAWVEQAMSNPLAHAVQAKMSGNEQLYRAVVNRVAQEDPIVAGQISSYAEMTAAEQARAAAAAPQAENASSEAQIGASVQRLGIDLPRYGPTMMEKIGEFGEYHPYTQAILHGSDQERDLALQAVYDLVREGRVTRRAVRDTERQETLQREGELRRQAAGVLTGGPRSSAPPPQSSFMDAMETEWRRAGQYSEE